MAPKTIWHRKTGKALTVEPIDAREILGAKDSLYTDADPAAKAPDGPAPEVVLLGASNVAREFDLGKRRVSVAEVVAARVKAKGMSPEAWNAMGDGQREKEIIEHVEVMKAQEYAATAVTGATGGAKAGGK